MSVAPIDEGQLFMAGFSTMNKIVAESRTLCQSVGTENDSSELRERLILLQRLMLKEIYITRIHLMECWRMGSEDSKAAGGMNAAEHLYAGFVTVVDYHMRALLNTLHLLNLFPTADTTLNFLKIGAPRTREGRSLSTTASTSLCHLIVTGLTQLPDLHTVLQATEEIEMTASDQESERDLLRSEYLSLQKLLEEVSSVMSIAPWTAFSCPTELMRRSSMSESDGDNVTLPSNFKFRFSDVTTATHLTLPSIKQEPENAKKSFSSAPSISEHQIEVIESGEPNKKKLKVHGKLTTLLLFLKNRRSLTIVMSGLLTLIILTVVLSIYAFTDSRDNFAENEETTAT